MHTTSFMPHKTALTALFLAGDLIIYFPVFCNKICTFWQTLSALILGTLFIIGTSFINSVPKSAKYLLLLPLLTILTKCIFSFADFTKGAILQKSASAVILTALAFLMLYLVFSQKCVLYKLSLILFLCVVISVFILFLFTFGNAEKSFAVPFFENFNIIGILQVFGTSFCPVIALNIIFSEKTAQKSYILGAILFSAMLLATLFSVMLLLGKFCENTVFPLCACGSIISFGRGFTRLEALAYAICHITVFIKCTVIFWAVKIIYKELKIPFKITMFFISAVLFVLKIKHSVLFYRLYAIALAIIFAISVYLFTKAIHTAVKSQAT